MTRFERDLRCLRCPSDIYNIVSIWMDSINGDDMDDDIDEAEKLFYMINLAKAGFDKMEWIFCETDGDNL